jgi:hypothetical protein
MIWSLRLRKEHRLRVFRSRKLMKMSGAKKDEVTGDWRRLHNEGLHDFYSSQNIFWVIKSRRMRWVVHMAWHEWWRIEMHTGFWWGSLKEGDHLEGLCIDGKIRLNGFYRIRLTWHGVDISGSGQG